jgi:hypothetical protein
MFPLVSREVEERKWVQLPYNFTTLEKSRLRC